MNIEDDRRHLSYDGVSAAKPRSDAEEALAFQLRAVSIPFEREFQFAPPRKWRADFAVHEGTMKHPDDRSLLVEVDGGSWTGGRHTSGAGFENDCLKLNAAAVAGYRVLRFTPRMVEDGTALATIEAAR